MSNVFLSNGSPFVRKKLPLPIYTYVSTPCQPIPPVQISKIKMYPSIVGRSKSPNRNDGYLSTRTQTSPFIKDTSLTQRDIELEDNESCRKMILKLSKEFDSLKTFIVDGKLEQENRQLKERVATLTSKLERIEKEYQHNLEIVSIKVDEILNENHRLKYQIEQCKEDREEEYQYLQQKQMKFLEECHEVMKIRKILDNELLDASKENRQKLIEIKDTEIRTLLTHIENFRHQIYDQQKFIKETYEYQLKKMHHFLQSTSDYEDENETIRRIKQELQEEKEAKRVLEKRLKECNHEKSTKDEQRDEYIEQLVREKIKQEQACLYFQNELQQVSSENEALKQEIDNLHQMINHRSVEFQFVQKQLNNEKEELQRMNLHLSEQLKYSSQKDDSSLMKELMRLKQKLEQKERENDQLMDELENLQKLQQSDDLRMKKNRIQSRLELNDQEENTDNQENEQLRLKIYELEALIEKYEQSQENIVRYVYEVIKENKDSDLGQIQDKIKESFLL